MGVSTCINVSSTVNMPVLWYDSTCTGYNVQNTTNVLWYQEHKTCRDVEHRTKPQDYELIDNMTSQPKVYHWWAQTGQLKTGYTGPWQNHTVCSGGKRRYGTHLYTRRPQKYFEDDMPAFKDWSTEIRLAIKDEAVNLGTTLAEYRQSVSMFGDAAKGIANAWKLFRGKHKRRRRLNTCSVAAAELVYSFGVSPLISDVYDSLEVLALRLNHPVRRRYFTSDKVSKSFSEDVPSTSGYNLSSCSAHYSQRVTAYVEFDLEKAAAITTGFQNPVSIAWELVPYSFVIDWMIPVGDYLASLDALRAVNDIDAVVVRKFKYGHRAFGHYKSSSYEYEGGSPNLLKYESHERIKYSTIPLPAAPRWEPSRSYRSLLNALALLVQTRGCKGRPVRTPLTRKT